MHFYSLWCVAIKLYDRLDSALFAQEYSSFMEQYIQTKEKQKEEDKEDKEDDNSSIYFIYASNSVGANTEYPQRKARHDSLIQAFSI